MQKIYHFTVSGDVQGVGFRYTIKEFAKTNKFLGTVKNNIDGSVEIELFGTKEDKKTLERFCKNNPGWSHVNRVEIQEITDENKANEFQKLNGFTIIR